MLDFTELPLNNAELEAYRLNARRFQRPHMLGGHLTRRRGQSLEFREFSRYTLGDDIRHVDWRASSRTAGQSYPVAGAGWLIRRFTAEEHFKLVVSLDVRETMLYPRIQTVRRSDQPAALNISKLQMARWLAAAVAFVALRSDDKVVFHRLFSEKPLFSPMRGRQGLAQIAGGLDKITAKIDTIESPNIHELDKHLPPASVWIIITDFYFDPDLSRKLIERIATAQDGMRWVLLVDLDSWPYERALLENSSPLRLIHGPGYNLAENLPFDNSMLGAVDEKIQQHKAQILHDCRKQTEDIIHWPWPADEITSQKTFGNFFTARFQQEKLLRDLFKRATWS